MQLKYSTLNFLSVVVHCPDKIITKESKYLFLEQLQGVTNWKVWIAVVADIEIGNNRCKQFHNKHLRME